MSTEIESTTPRRPWSGSVVRISARDCLFLVPGLRTASRRRAGVYFLTIGEDVVYVGQSDNVIRRIEDHRQNRQRPFEQAYWLEVSLERLDEVESAFIWYFSPRYNRNRPRISSSRIFSILDGFDLFVGKEWK